MLPAGLTNTLTAQAEWKEWLTPADLAVLIDVQANTAANYQSQCWSRGYLDCRVCPSKNKRPTIHNRRYRINWKGFAAMKNGG